VLYKVKTERSKDESLDGGAVNELLVGLREGDMTKGTETNRSKKTGVSELSVSPPNNNPMISSV
jgi:hypothetical protein